MIKAKLLRTGIGWGMLVVIAQSCATGEEAETRTSALSPSDRPAGLVCGLAYSGQMVNEPGIWPLVPGLTPVDGKCLGKSTIKANPYRVVNGAGGPTADGYGVGHEGDNGLNRLWAVYLGYQSQFLGVSTGDAEYASSFLMLPKGAACGFKFTCGGNGGNGGSNCMSYNPQWECPPGWQQRQANDANSSSGCNFAWCEY